jgi:hypothetical protein
VSRPATSRLKVNPQLGNRPSLEFRRVDELAVDPAYQRSILAGPSQTLIRKIAQFWDWGLCQPLTVAKRDDGRLYVVDGQHRLEAARLRGDIFDLPCVVTSYSNAGDEAAAFVALNQQRRPLSGLDLFKAALAAEDESAKAVMAALTDAGLGLAPHTNHTAWKPGMVSNIQGILECHRVGGDQVLRTSLGILAKAFEGQILQYAGTIFVGLWRLVAHEKRIEGGIDADRLAAVLGRHPQRHWVQEIRLEQVAADDPRPIAAMRIIQQAYTGRRIAPAPKTAPAAQSTLPPAMMMFCEQCDRRVSGAQVNRCTDRFCKAKAVAA